jgi:hypothetical protein
MQAKFDASKSKRNIARARPAGPESGADDRLRALLLDRDQQASNQPRHFVELPGIMILDRSCKAGEAFLVGHHRHIAWDNRRYRTVGLNDRHNNTSRIEPAKQASCLNKTF